MDLTTDKALDMIPYLVEIYEKLDFKDTEGSAQEIGRKAIVHVLKNINKFKPEIYGIVAVATGESADVVGKKPVISVLVTFKKIYNDIFKNQEILDFFGSAMQSATSDQ